MTACNTRLSSGLRLGSLVEERMPVPQLLARVLLCVKQKQESKRPYTFTIMEDIFNVSQTYLSKKAASSLLRRTLCLVPALTWQFISWAREMYTLVPVDQIHESCLKGGKLNSYECTQDIQADTYWKTDKWFMTHRFAWMHSNPKNEY